MANRRMINKSISVSEQANELDDFSALLFSWMIPHADDYGVIVGTAKKIKALVVPMRKQTAEQVETALSKMQKAGLVWRYIYKEEEHLQYCKWDDHQELHKRTAPKNATYDMAREDSGNFREMPGNSVPTQPNLTQPNLGEYKGNLPGSSGKVTYSEHVSMTAEEYAKLVEKFGEEGAKDKIEALNLWKGSKGKKTASDYMTILNWDRRDKKNRSLSKGGFTRPGRVIPKVVGEEFPEL